MPRKSVGKATKAKEEPMGFIRGIKTSEFWGVFGTIALIAVQQFAGMFEAQAQQIGDQIVMVTPANVWASVGAAVAAGFFAIARGLAKSALLKGGQ